MKFIQIDLFYVVLGRSLLITQVAAAKMRDGVAIYSPEQHEKVIREWDEMCRDIGMPEEMIDHLMHPTIVDTMNHSVVYQELMVQDPEVFGKTEKYLDLVYKALLDEKKRASNQGHRFLFSKRIPRRSV